MYKIDFKKPANIFFIGIGGISMSGLAKILICKGFQISGSDCKRNEACEALEKLGAEIHYGHREENIKEEVEYIVYTAAIHEDNPEMKEAGKRGLPLIGRAQLLGWLMENYRTSIAVSGTHGKTTVTSMISHILMEAGLDPTISIGGMLPLIGGNVRIGAEEVFLTEACEYTNSFHDLYPNYEIILNIEADHLDFFKDIEEIRASFQKFILNMGEEGTLILNGKIAKAEELCEGFCGRLLRFGTEDADVYAKNIEYDEFGSPSFDLIAGGEKIGRIRLSVIGEHNIDNALAAIALALALGIGIEEIQKGLAGFCCVGRRFEHKGKIGEINIVDDYAHHPQEIEATLRAARRYPHRKIYCVFQPHTYTRTKAMLAEFAKALRLADVVVLTKIYAARESDTLGVSSRDILNLIRKEGGEAYYFDSFDEVENFLLENLCAQDLCITMGAGDIVKVGESLLGN
ncbi:MAG: UDP-N-acetylmuramate--L-alanine ligase [Johnsonella sp.]|nr:UDP-N-acetylmuramate--L-alanine ligase [Johnsonella sp.]